MIIGDKTQSKIYLKQLYLPGKHTWILIELFWNQNSEYFSNTLTTTYSTTHGVSSAWESITKIFFLIVCVLVELWELNRTWLFQAGEGRLQHYSMLLDETQERLIVGGKDILYSLNLEHITAPYKEVHSFVYMFSGNMSVQHCHLSVCVKYSLSAYLALECANHFTSVLSVTTHTY